MVTSLFFYFALRQTIVNQSYLMAVVALLTITSWLIVTLVTPPEDKWHLLGFYRKVRPPP